MQDQDRNGLPPFPLPPPGILRSQHLPTIEASIGYWEFVRARALAEGDHDLVRTAAGLRLSHEAARRERLQAGRTAERGRSDRSDIGRG
jgi:hypothetical protein